MLNIEHVTGLLAQTVSGQRNHANLLWKVLNLMVWANRVKVDLV